MQKINWDVKQTVLGIKLKNRFLYVFLYKAGSKNVLFSDGSLCWSTLQRRVSDRLCKWIEEARELDGVQVGWIFHLEINQNALRISDIASDLCRIDGDGLGFKWLLSWWQIE